ncbi:neural/ectodermal development factor IMP-L2, partial [Biomphalaria glabrata]
NRTFAMLTRLQSVAIIVCLVYVPQLASAHSRRLALNKRNLTSTNIDSLRRLSISMQPLETRIALYDGIVLSCQVTGRPNPTIHWLKNGERVQQ